MEGGTPAGGPEEKPAGELESRRILLRVTVIGVAVIVGIVAWLASRGDDDSSPAPPEPESRIVSEAELLETAANSGQPIYWAGPVSGTELELIEVVSGGYQVRYVPEGEAADGAFLTVGSYPLADPVGSLNDFAEQPGSVTRRASDGRKVVTSEESPTNVYFVSPDNSVQVEIYDPSPQRAMSLAVSGGVEPVG